MIEYKMPFPTRRILMALAPVVGLMAVAAPAQAADPKGDPVHGQVVYAQCKACHSLDAGKNMIGPSLNKSVGRKAGSVASFKYSPAMQKSGITWTPKELSEFLTAPMKKVPGSRMPFAGISNPQDRADVIAYLAKN